MKKLIKEQYCVNHKDVHSDAGEGFSIECPNCRQEIVFASAQWWGSTCECGDWELEQKAVLSTNTEET